MVAAAVLILDSRLRTALVAYVIFTACALWLSRPQEPHANAAGIALFCTLAFIKIAIGPAALIWLRRTYRVPDDLAPSFNLGVRCGVVALAVFLGEAAARLQAFSGVPNAALVFYCLFTSICIVILHRNLLAHVVGLLAFGSAVTLAAAVFAPALPGAVEMADTFDAAIATLIAISVARAVMPHDSRLDIRSLRELWG